MESSSDVLTILEGRVARTIESKQRRLTLTTSQVKRLVVCLGESKCPSDIYFALKKRAEHAVEVKVRYVSITLKQANEVLTLLKTAGNVEENL